MDATQMISDSILESDDEENEQENENKKGSPLAKLCILKNEHTSETELPLFLGDNVLGRDPNTCALTLPAPSISKQHATISISVYRRTGCHSEVDIEALVWDLGSMNGTHKGRIKLTPNVRYALSDGDSLVLADIPCHYVNCAVNTVSSQEDMRTSVSRNLVLGQKRGDTSTGSKKCVNGGTKATMSLTKTPVRTSCLSFEQTPTQPQGMLVPESDLDSDDEGRGGRKALVSDSDSHKSSPTCSTFLSPTNKIVPESEDESPITPSSSTKTRPYRDVNKEETDVDVGRQQLTKKLGLVILDDSEKEQRREEERVITGGAESDKNCHHAEAKQEDIGEDELPVPTLEVSTHTVPAFNLESDTDTEGEQEGVAFAHSVSLNQISQPPNTDQFYMDSDTDIDEDEDAVDKAPKTVPCFDDDTKPPHVVAVIQPHGVTVDSDTDVEDNAAVSDAATKANPLSFHGTHIADSASSTQLKDFYVESDTDFDDEDKAAECGKNKPSSKRDACHTRLDVNSIGPKFTTPDAGADLNILPDSDTDVEDDCPLVIPVTVTTLSVSPTVMSDALQSDSDADTDVDESSVPPAEDVDNPADLRVDSGTDVENKETDTQEPGEGQIPNLLKEKTPGLLLPVLQNCSTPVQFSGEVENMETQSFLSPSSAPFRPLPCCSDCQEDDDFVVAETQSFILHTKDCQGNPPDDHTMNPIHAFDLEHSDDEKDEQSSNGASFQLGFSDSSHLQCQAQALAIECTQAFVPVDRNVKLEDTQACGALLTADRTSTGNASNLEATQSYGEDEESARNSLVPEKEGQVDLALEATQAYISEPYSNSEDETNKDETRNTNAESEPLDFPTSSTLTMAETQPMSAFEDEETLATDRLASSVQQVKSRTQNETEERGEHGVVLQTHQRPFSEVLPIAETQPMDTIKDRQSDDESDDEDLFPGPQKRKAKLLQLEEEQTQPHIISETQPMHIVVAEAWNWESDVDLTVPGLQNKEGKTQRLINPELSIVETQPMNIAEDEESDEDSISGFQKRSAKPQQLEEEIQPHSSSEVAVVKSRPVGACEDEKSSDEDSIQGPCKRKAKPLQIEEEQTQPLSCSEVSAVETQPIVMSEDVESSDEDSIPGPRKRNAKARQLEKEGKQLLTNPDVSTVEIQPLETKTDVQPERVRERQSEAGSSGVIVGNKRGTLEQLKEEQHQGKCSDIPKTQTRGKNKVLPTIRGRREKYRSYDEEEEVEQPKRARGKKSMRQQKNDKEEEEQIETERHSENKEKREKERVEEENNVVNLGEQKKEKMEKENGEEDEREAEEDEFERQQRGEQQQKLERKKEQERLKGKNAESIKLEQGGGEKERKEQEENERYDQVQREKERFKRERTQNEETDHEKAEREEKENFEMGRKEQEQKERLEAEKKEQDQLERERNKQEHQQRVEREERERLEKDKEAKEKQRTEQQENKEDENKPRVPVRGRRGARTITTQPEQDSALSTNDDVPARRTRSRSNSSNSVSSERSASSINTQESRGRGRGRGIKRPSEPPQAAITRSSNRRRTVAAETSQQHSSPQGLRSRAHSSNSLNSEVSSCLVGSQVRGRGGRQRGRERTTEPDSIPPVSSQSNQNSAPKPAARGRKSRKAEGSSSDVFQEEGKEKADSQLATRGRWQASESASEPAAADEEDQSNQEGCHASKGSPLSKRNVRVRSQAVEKRETVATPGPPLVSEGGQAKDKKIGRKRVLEENTEEDLGSNSKIAKGNEKVQTETRKEKEKNETKDVNPVQTKRRGRASSTRGKKNAGKYPPKVEMKEESEKMEVETVEKRERGRPSAVQNKKKEVQENNGGTSVCSMSQDAKVAASQPQTPISSTSRKRGTPADSSPVAKATRSSSASPAASSRLRATSQSYKVLFTGVVDEGGDRVLAGLGGSMAKDVADMNCLVTDKVRRTVKFLCAVAKGIPIVTTHWLEKSGKAGRFLPPNAFIVKDPEQEKKFSFSLQESLSTASSQSLLQGYEIHVTKSVKPEPVQMKDIISCGGATFLPKMPSSHKPQTVVISCEEDWLLCAPAVSASLPVVTSEFILTGILQQKLDFQTHTLSAPANNLQPAGGRGRIRKKT